MLSTQQVYKDQDKIYHADTCQPLIAANQEGKLQLEAWQNSNTYFYAGWYSSHCKSRTPARAI